MKLFNSSSLAEKQRLVEKDERNIQERQAQAQQQQLQIQQQEIEQKAMMEQAKMQQEDALNQRDNETKILIAQINASSKMNDLDDGIQEPMSEEAREKLRESIRQFDERLALDKEKLQLDKDKARTDAELKRKQINKPRTSSSK